MNQIDELLEKYFAGKTTLQEEKELKSYFAGENLDANHKKLSPLFSAFVTEKETVSPVVSEIKNTAHFSLRRKISIITVGAVAASLLLFFTLRFQPSEDYMIVRGKRINNPEMAREFANAKLEKSLSIIQKSISLYENNELLQQHLKETENTEK